MKRVRSLAAPTALVVGLVAGPVLAQQPQGPQPHTVGNPLGLQVIPTPGCPFEPISANVKVYGAISSAESCSYDAERGLIVVPNRGVPQNVQTNDAWVSFINSDGSVHTARWIGVHGPAERARLTPPLVLNEPFGSDIARGMLYVADRDGGTGADDPSVAVIRWFDLRTGVPAGEVRVAGAPWLNDIEVAEDGTIYATQTGDFGNDPDPNTRRVWRIAPDGTASVFVQGAPLRMPNGIGFDPQGNIVVVNFGNDEVLTFSPSGRRVGTEQAAQPGSDGLVIMPDGTKYVSSVTQGGSPAFGRVSPPSSSPATSRAPPRCATTPVPTSA